MHRGLGILALMLFALAALGVTVPWSTAPTIVVLVDRTASTRTAAWYDADAEPLIRAALGRTADRVQFLDVPAQLTVAPDADVVVVFGDGRLPRPAGMPPTLLVTDPRLDTPGDARIVDLSSAAATVVADRATTLTVTGATADRTDVPAGRVVSLSDATGPVTVTTAGDDSWPENDQRSIEALPNTTRIWHADRPAPPGWETARRIPGNASVVYAERFDADIAGHLARGGGLIVGDLTALPPSLRDVSPLSPTPPAGDREWLLLLDVSGSMGRADRLERGIAALRAAAAQLPGDAKRGVGSFAGNLRWWERGVAASQRLRVPTDLAAGGPTNLRLALRAIAEESTGPRELLLLSDGAAELGDLDELALPGLRISAVVLGEDVPPALRALVQRTGGVLGAGTDWANVAADIAGAAALPTVPPDAQVQWPGVATRTTARRQAWLRDGATAVARFESGDSAVGLWQVGLARVAATAFSPTAAEIEILAERVAAAPADPSVAVTRVGDQFQLTADARPTVLLDGIELPLTRQTPTTYTADLPAPRPAGTVAVFLGELRATTLPVPSAYDPEFSALGNVGGDARIGERLELPRESRSLHLMPWLGLAGLLLGTIALLKGRR